MADNTRYEDVCILCHRTESQAGKMIHLPGDICICTDCMQKTMDTMQNMGLTPQNFPFGFPQNPWAGSDASGTPGQNPAAPQGTPEADDIEPKKIESDVVNPDGTPAVPAGEDDAEQKTPGDGQNSSDGAGNNGQNPSGGFPNVSFLNLGDLFGGGMPVNQGPRIRKRHKLGPQSDAAGSAENADDDYPILDIHNIPAPHKIKAQLDQYVVGQDKAKKIMSVAVYNHYKRIASEQQNEQQLGTAEDLDGVDIEKSNILLIGPTGSGKTYMVRTLARLLDVPLAITDATSLTEAGYIGDDIESVVSKLLAAADNDVDRAEEGIIFIDEIDKLAKKKNATQRDVSGESVQQGMLKLLEGAEIEVPVGASSKNAMVPMATVNTKNILFICGGAFPGLEDIIKERLTQRSLMGFNSDLGDEYDHDIHILEKVRAEDLRNFGMIPEFLGRLPIVTALDQLDEDMLVRILTEPKNAIIKQYQKLLALDDVKLTFDEGAYRAIARKAAKEDLGARALRSIIEEYMMDIMYEIPKDPDIGEVEITEDYIEHRGGPRVTMRTTERIASHSEPEKPEKPEE